MALTVRMLSLVSRLSHRAPAAFNAWSCRFKSRDAGATVWTDHHTQRHTQQYSRAYDRKPRRPQEMFEGEEAELEDVEDKLQKIMDEETKRQRTVRYHKIKRQKLYVVAKTFVAFSLIFQSLM